MAKRQDQNHGEHDKYEIERQNNKKLFFKFNVRALFKKASFVGIQEGFMNAAVIGNLLVVIKRSKTQILFLVRKMIGRNFT